MTRAQLGRFWAEQRVGSGKLPWVLLVVGVSLSWLGVSLSPTAAFLSWGCALSLVAFRKIRLLMFGLLLSPVFFCFSFGVIQYSRGTAVLQLAGDPTLEPGNLDHFTRCPVSLSGDIIYGHEWVRQVPYNSAVRILSLLFGPMQGAYVGPYLTETEAMRLLRENGQPVQLELLMADQLAFEEENFVLDCGVGLSFFAPSEYFGQPVFSAERVHELSELYGFHKASVARVGAELGIVFIPFDGLWSLRAADELAGRIILVDLERGRPFACYGTNGYDTSGLAFYLQQANYCE
jgi:hypothetical protein